MKYVLNIFAMAVLAFSFVPKTADAAYPFGDEVVRYTFENASTTAVTNLGTGGSTYDTAFSGNAALLATTSLAGNYAAVFDDNGDFINTKFGSSTNPTTQPFSISMWVIASTSCATVDKHVFGLSATPAASRFYMRCGSAGPNKFVIRVQGQSAVISSTTVSYGQRYNVMMIASSTASKAFFYVNGALTASSTYTSYTLPGPIYIGNIWENASTPANQGFGGFIDEVSIWNRALTPSEIADVSSYLSTSTAPTGLAGTGYDSKVALSWTAPSSTSAPTTTDYQIEYKLTASSSYTVFTDGVSTIASTTVTGLTIGQSYDFRVSSVNSNGTSTPTSAVTVTPVTRMEWVSPTPSQSSTINTSSITVYASTSPSSYTGTTTQVIRLETAAGALVSQVSTTTRYGDGNLTRYVNQVSGRNLSLTTDSSGAAYVPTTNTFFIPHNVSAGSNSTIDEVDTEGVLIRTITCTACGDNESITLVSSTASTTAGGFDHVFMLGTENNTSSSTMFRMRIHSSSGTTANYTDFFNLGVAHGTNLGMEGIAYDAVRDLFYLATEKSNAGADPGKLYEVKLNGASKNLQATQICSNLNFSSIASDFSDLTYKDNILYVLSHENDRLIPINITSTSTCAFVDSDGDSNTTNDTGDYLNTLGVTQPEGVALDHTGDYLYFIGEADNYSRYRSTAFTSRTTFTGLSNGNYVLKSYFTDVNGILSSSTDRAFTVNVDVTPPAISNIATSSVSTTTATIAWDTDETATSQIIYGTTISYGATTTLDATLVSTHSVALTGLAPGTTYNYKVISVDATGNGATSTNQTFTTDSIDSVPPTVSLSSPLTGAAIATTTSIVATSSDNVGVVGVKFYRGSTLIGSEDTTNPYSVNFDTTAVADGAYTLVAVARDAAGNIATSSIVSVAVDNTGPVASSVASSTTVTTASVSWMTSEVASSSVRYGLTTSYGTVASSSAISSHSASLSGLVAETVYHFSILAIDTLGNVSTSSDYTFTTAEGSAPAIEIIEPTATTTGMGNISFTASSSDNVAVAGVSFYVGGSLVGSEDTAAPYGITVNTSSYSNGSTTFTAVARDSSNNQATTSVTILISNTAAAAAANNLPVIGQATAVSSAPSVASGFSPAIQALFDKMRADRGEPVASQNNNAVPPKNEGVAAGDPIKRLIDKKGTVSPEIKLVQKVLNMSKDTQVAKSGVGSPGKETTIYGPATIEAIKKFQVKYKLVANTQDPGYGKIGPKTRAKMNQLLKKTQ